VEGGNSSPLLSTGEATAGVLCSARGSGYEKDMDILEQAQQRATKRIKALEQIACEERLRELGLFCLEQGRLEGILPMFANT